MDREALDACAAALPGTHDFTAFTPTQTDHVHFDRKIFAAAWNQEGDILSFHITADAFMRNMVRILVGTMLEVASDRRTLDSFTQLLEGAPRPAAGRHGPTARPVPGVSQPTRARPALGRPSQSSPTASGPT